MIRPWLYVETDERAFCIKAGTPIHKVTDLGEQEELVEIDFVDYKNQEEVEA